MDHFEGYDISPPATPPRKNPYSAGIWLQCSPRTERLQRRAFRIFNSSPTSKRVVSTKLFDVDIPPIAISWMSDTVEEKCGFITENNKN